MDQKEVVLNKESPSITKDVIIPLPSWPKYYVQEYLELDNQQSYILRALLINSSQYEQPDLYISIFDKIIKNSTHKQFSPTIGTFFILDFYNLKSNKSQEFIQCYRDLYFYPEFTDNIVEKVQPLEQQEVLSTPETFFSALVVNNLKNEDLRNIAVSQIEKERDCRGTILSVVNQFI
jgi:hypothetical protein